MTWYYWGNIRAGYLQKRTGFTIVELLIVIVVISLFMAIVIVAFNGVRERANNTKTVKCGNILGKGYENV